MGWGKALACLAGGAVAIVAAPVVLPVAAAAGGAALAVGGAVAGTVAAAGSAAAGAVGATAVGGAIVGAATAVGSAVAGSTVGAAALGAAASVGAAAATATTATVGAVGASGVAAAIGAGATYSALTTKESFDNLAEAKELIAEAEELHDSSKKKYEASAKRTASRLEDLLKRKMEIYSNTIGPSIAIIRQFREVRESEIDFKEGEFAAPVFTEDEIQQIETTATEAAEVLSEVARGATLVRAASGGAFAFMAQFGSASTGTAISSLSGAAQTNATLAALGGGALAAGKGGMALGSAVLGGVTILPATIVLSYKFAADSERKLTEAHKHFSKVKEDGEKLETAVAALKIIDRRTRELKHATTRLSELYMDRLFPRLNAVYEDNKKPDGTVLFPSLQQKEKSTVVLATHFVRTIKKVVSVKVLDDAGNPSRESEQALLVSKQEVAQLEA